MVLRAFLVCLALTPTAEADPNVELYLKTIVVKGVKVEVFVEEPTPNERPYGLQKPSVRYGKNDGYQLSVDTGEVRYHPPTFIYDFYLESPGGTLRIPVRMHSGPGFDPIVMPVEFLLHANGDEREFKFSLPIFSHMPSEYVEYEIDWDDVSRKAVEADLQAVTRHVITLRNKLDDFTVSVEKGEILESEGLRAQLIFASDGEEEKLVLPAGGGATGTLQLVLNPTFGAAVSQALGRRDHWVRVPLQYQAGGVGTKKPLPITVNVRIVPSLLLLLICWVLGVSLGSWGSFEMYRRRKLHQTWRDLRVCIFVATVVTLFVFFMDWLGNAVVFFGHKVDPYHPLAVIVLSLFVSLNSRKSWRWIKDRRIFGDKE